MVGVPWERRVENRVEVHLAKLLLFGRLVILMPCVVSVMVFLLLC